mmetsp:Transcript_10675/g.28421  ORF Transcript_10675/g.28421 Transcript_10675/m.28421 type:complete len:205 (+) Transcript_10675:690-1304(+)
MQAGRQALGLAPVLIARMVSSRQLEPRLAQAVPVGPSPRLALPPAPRVSRGRSPAPVRPRAPRATQASVRAQVVHSVRIAMAGHGRTQAHPRALVAMRASGRVQPQVHALNAMSASPAPALRRHARLAVLDGSRASLVWPHVRTAQKGRPTVGLARQSVPTAPQATLAHVWACPHASSVARKLLITSTGRATLLRRARRRVISV